MAVRPFGYYANTIFAHVSSRASSRKATTPTVICSTLYLDKLVGAPRIRSKHLQEWPPLSSIALRQPFRPSLQSWSSTFDLIRHALLRWHAGLQTTGFFHPGSLPCLVPRVIRLRLRSQPVLNLFCLLPSVDERMLTLGISRAVLASRPVCLFAVKVRAAFPHPGSHACATELVSAIALRVAARFCWLDRSVAVGTDFVSFASLSFCVAVNGVQPTAIFAAALICVFWTVAGDADTEGAVSAGEDTSIFLTVERLLEPGATGHAHNAVLEFFSIPGT